MTADNIPISIAIASIVSTIKWEVENDYDLSTITWKDTEVTRPTDEEIQAVRQRMADEKNANAYKEKRASAYPSFADQFDLLYHGGYDAWKAAIDAVKQEYPKP